MRLAMPSLEKEITSLNYAVVFVTGFCRERCEYFGALDLSSMTTLVTVNLPLD